MNIKEEILWKGEKAIKATSHVGNTGIMFTFLVLKKVTINTTFVLSSLL